MYLLRYTNDTLNAIPGYPPQPEAVPHLKGWLDVLDRGWSAVLQRRRWDTANREGTGVAQESLAVNMTERTRLKSLLLSGTESLAEWLERTRKAQLQEFAKAAEDEGNEELEGETVNMEAFEDVFSRTLEDLGQKSGDDAPQMTGLVEPELLLQSELEGDGDMLAFDDIDE